jgi:hypothetical protein
MPNKKTTTPTPSEMLGFMLLAQKPLLGFRESTDLLEDIGPKDPTSLEN